MKPKPTRGQLDEAIAIWERDVMSKVPKTRGGQHMIPNEVRSTHGELFFTILDKVIKRRAGSRHY